MLAELTSVLGLSLTELPRHPLLRAFPSPSVRCFEDAVHLLYPSAGLSILCGPRDGVTAVQLHAREHDGDEAWARPLPAGLVFGMSRAQVRERLREPDASSGGQFVAGLGWKPACDVFRAAGGEIHVEYQPVSSARLQLLRVQKHRPHAQTH